MRLLRTCCWIKGLTIGLLVSVALGGCRSTETAHEAVGEDAIGAPQAAAVLASWTDVRGLIATNCLDCHAGQGPAAGLDLSLASAVREEALSGRLLARLHDDVYPMPPSGILPASDLRRVSQWIEQGAYVEDPASGSSGGE